MECPFIEKNIIEDEHNRPIKYKELGGELEYVFWDHTTPGGDIERVQFCKKIGRKKDVFECLNENEWINCYAYK